VLSVAAALLPHPTAKHKHAATAAKPSPSATAGWPLALAFLSALRAGALSITKAVRLVFTARFARQWQHCQKGARH